MGKNGTILDSLPSTHVSSIRIREMINWSCANIEQSIKYLIELDSRPMFALTAFDFNGEENNEIDVFALWIVVELLFLIPFLLCVCLLFVSIRGLFI